MVYTKTGDKGTTSLVGGTRVPKYDLRVECYGTLDELNCHLGLLRDLILKREKQLGKSKTDIINNVNGIEILSIMTTLFNAQAIVACEKEDVKKTIPLVTDENIAMLEKRIDVLEKELPIMKSFILPTGYYLASEINIARTICRRAERLLCKLNDEKGVNENVLKYTNRLSDYLFVLSRKMMKDKKREEILWKPEIK